MIERSEEILVGITVSMKAIGVERAVIGIENNKRDAVSLFQNRIQKLGFRGIEVCPLKVKYPQGGEKQLIEAVTGRRVPSGALPIEVGAVVQNVGTSFAVYEAVQKDKPLIERILTVTGKQVKEPGNFRVRIGTPLIDAANFAGGIPENTGKYVAGGPMMGRAVASLEIPAAKGSAGILFIPEGESARREMKNCIRCARCVRVCPMGLEPYLLMSLCENSLWERMESERTMDCIECGCCSYICPSNRPLLDHIRFGKSTVGNIIRNRNAKIN